ncbi:MAG: Nif3-like dinuclear metal center hexameric protein [Clostridia bacterium]|nr:Nif3-like dinuclear metal center hexameric protein [Clostridia bacterium]
MTAGELYRALDARYPKELSCPWDNDGLMVCPDMDAEVKRVLVALDASAETLAYAVKKRFDMVVTHHPMLFKGLKSVSERSVHGRHVLTALRSGITVLSFHTRLDAAEGGVNDALCAALGLMADGTFGDDEAPALGRLVTLAGPEEEGIPAREAAEHIKTSLGCVSVRLNGDPEKTVRRMAVCGGDGKDFIYPALAAGADLFLTGDAGYNMAGEAAEDGIVTVEAGHYHTEAPVCGVLADVLRELSGAYVEIYDSCTYTVV